MHFRITTTQCTASGHDLRRRHHHHIHTQKHTKSRQTNLYSVHAGACSIYGQSRPQNKQQCITHGNTPTVLGLTLHLKLTYSTLIHNISVHAHKLLHIIKAPLQHDGVKGGDTYGYLQGSYETGSGVWSPLATSTSINKMQVMQNAALKNATGYTQNINIQHLHDETLTLPIHEHLQLHASQYKQKTQHPSHHIHKHTTYFNTPRLKPTIINNGRYKKNIPTDSHTVTIADIKTCAIYIHLLSLNI